jgi:hypothetical protein
MFGVAITGIRCESGADRQAVSGRTGSQQARGRQVAQAYEEQIGYRLMGVAVLWSPGQVPRAVTRFEFRRARRGGLSRPAFRNLERR